ncbi:MAG: SocA family protein [Bacteroidia bacterium]|nr:SocA family protein [Bacteroidia bacterium]
MRGFNYKKATQALNYLALKNGGSLNKMKAIKLIWLADRFHLRKYGRTITGDVYFALPFGPIPSTTRDILEQNTILSDVELSYSQDFLAIDDRYNFSATKETATKVFSQTDLEVINEVVKNYNQLDEFILSELSHKSPEWKKYESAFQKGIASRFEINPIDFFLNFDDGKGLFLDSEEHIEISKKIFMENTKILEAF